MCGRFSFSIPSKAKSLVKLGVPKAEIDSLKPRYNIVPSQQVAAIVDDGSRHFEPLRWGLYTPYTGRRSRGEVRI